MNAPEREPTDEELRAFRERLKERSKHLPSVPWLLATGVLTYVLQGAWIVLITIIYVIAVTPILILMGIEKVFRAFFPRR